MKQSEVIISYPFPELVAHPLFQPAKPMQSAWVSIRPTLSRRRLKNEAVVTTEGTGSPFFTPEKLLRSVDVDYQVFYTFHIWVKRGGSLQ